MKPILIGIVGGSCSGKTTFARKLFNHFGERSLLLSQDSFYKSLDSNVDINNYDFDDPQAIDFEKMENVIKDIINKDKFVKIPIYDFKTARDNGHYKNQTPKKYAIDDKKKVISIYNKMKEACNDEKERTEVEHHLRALFHNNKLLR